ncbi:MAG: TolB family protein, partial [Betaproteobacteria bacterium]
APAPPPASPPPSPPPPPAPRATRIGTATAPVGGSTSIVTVASDGGDSQTVKSFAGRLVQFPRWSPDGRRIAFFDSSQPLISGDNLYMVALYVMDADGSHERQVGWCEPGANTLDWHADSRHLLFTQRLSLRISGSNPARVSSGRPLVVDTDTLKVPWMGRRPNMDEVNLPPGVGVEGWVSQVFWCNPVPAGGSVPLRGLKFFYNQMTQRETLATDTTPGKSESWLQADLAASVALDGATTQTDLMMPYNGQTALAPRAWVQAVAPASQDMVFLQFAPGDTYSSGELILQSADGAWLSLGLADPRNGPFSFSPDQSLCCWSGGVYRWADFRAGRADAPGAYVGAHPFRGVGHWHLAA